MGNKVCMDSVLNEYLKVILSCDNVERKINSLINLGSLCYDYNQDSYASQVYKKALDICLENENGSYPRFMEEALAAARSIQTSKKTVAQYEEVVRRFYQERFPTYVE